MTLVITPRQLAAKSRFYHQLSSLTRAGVGLVQGLEMIAKNPPNRSFLSPLSQLLSDLNSGFTFGESLHRLNHWLPGFDIALLEAGEKSGRLDSCFTLLAQYYEERARLFRNLISDLAYPFLVIHLALFIFPPHLLSQLVWEGNASVFLWQKFSVFAPLYLLIGLLLVAFQSRRGDRWRAFMEQFLQRIPVLGAGISNLALARLSSSLEGLLAAGVSVVPAWHLAASTSGSPALRKAVHGWLPAVEMGQTPSECLRNSTAFPDLFSSLYATGELSGQLDDTLRRLYVHYQEEGSRKIRAVSQWTPRLIYFAVLLLVGYQIISFWTGYYSGILNNF